MVKGWLIFLLCLGCAHVPPEIEVHRKKYPEKRPQWVVQQAPPVEVLPPLEPVVVEPVVVSAPPVQLKKEYRVGVLLPLHGKFASFGKKTLRGIQWALDPTLLRIEDTGETEQEALAALKRLLDQDVIAVLGPLMSKEVDVLSPLAQAEKVPIITLARRTITQQDYVFSAGLTQEMQVRTLIDFAVKQFHVKNFAILYPEDKFGRGFCQTFWDEIERIGVHVVGNEAYRPDETDFRQIVDKLSGLYYPEARHRELQLLAQERAANHIVKRTRRTEKFYQLKPIVDYEAVFIPDGPQIAGQVIPAFAYRDIEQVKFLGTAAWNSPEFLTRVQNYGEGSLLVDALFVQSQVPRVKEWIEQFQKQFEELPSSFEALAYDAASLLKNVLQNNPSSREQLKTELQQVKDFPGITGLISYENQQFFRSLTVLTVRNGSFVEVNL